MKKATSEYLKIPLGQWGRYNWRKIHRRSHYLFEMEPKSKTAMKISEKVALQHEILKQMKQLHKTAYRGRIVAEFSIKPTSKNPPHIYTVVKNLLDIFSVPSYESGIKRKGLIYQNDRQIAYLSVKYRISNDSPQISVRFAPLGDFIQDLTLAEDIMSGKYNNYFDNWDLSRDIKESDDYNENLNEAWHDFRDLERNKNIYIQRFGKKGYDSIVKMNQMQLQASFFNRFRLSVRDVYLLYHASGQIPKSEGMVFPEVNKLARNLSSQLAKWIINSPINIKLPRVPIRNGEKQKFKSEVKESLKSYREKYKKILEPLYIPVALEAIYKPPPVSQGFSKDLDNIMMLILPIFHDEFKPPLTFISKMDLKEIPDERIVERMRPLIEALRKSVKYSVSRYEILEIPRHQSDQDDGFIIIGISGVLRTESLWKRINEVIDKWQKNCNIGY